MAYDAAARRVAVKAIGTVESNLNYQSINYNDPITVGVMQWYGTRAAALLGRIRSENAGTWTGVPASLTNDLNAHAATDSWWTTRYLTRAEGEPLRAVLNANKAIQNDVAFSDMDGYRDVAVRAGMNAETNTAAMLFFFVMYHQSPRRALAVLAAAGPSSNLDRLLASALNEPVLGKYRTRYQTAANIIRSNDPSGVDNTPGTPDPGPETGGDSGGDGQERAQGDIRYIQAVGDALHVHYRDGHVIIAYPNGQNTFTPRQDGTVGAEVPPPPPNPNPSTPGGGSATQQALVQFVTSRIGRYAYSQGATRLNPEQNMYTDCSGLMYFAYQSVMGINIGTYTGNQWDKGTLVTQGSGTINESLLQPGDLVFFDWRGGRTTVDHVDMYIGGGNVCGHGGPGNGPNTKPLAERVAGAVKYVVRRHA